GKSKAGLFQQVAVEGVVGCFDAAGFIVGVVGAAEQVNGCCIAGLEARFGLGVAVDDGCAKGGRVRGAVSAPRSQRGRQGVGGRHLQGSLAVGAFDRAAGGVENDTGGAGVDELLPPGASLQVVNLLGGSSAERVGDLQQIAVDVVDVSGGHGRGGGSLGVLDDASERVEKVAGWCVPVCGPGGGAGRVGAPGVVVLVVAVGFPC